MTARIDAAVAKAIAAIPETAWVPIPYWDAVEDDDGIIVASSAEVAEITYTAFTSTRAPVTARLVVRRVRRLRDAATRQPLDQQSIAELKQGPLAHLPSADFWANAACLTLAAMTINMGRAIAALAGHGLGEATLATLQRTLLAVPARLARSARRYHLHPAHPLALPERPLRHERTCCGPPDQHAPVREGSPARLQCRPAKCAIITCQVGK